MNFDQFENQARLYAVGALEEEELSEFEAARREFGARAEASIQECRRLSAAFALSLRPCAPRADARERLLEMIEKSRQKKAGNGNGSEPGAEYAE